MAQWAGEKGRYDVERDEIERRVDTLEMGSH